MELPLHVIKDPVGTFSYVGSIPTVLGTMVPASKSDVLGCRAFYNDNDEPMVYKFPTFSTEQEAIDFAQAKGYTARLPIKK